MQTSRRDGLGWAGTGNPKIRLVVLNGILHVDGAVLMIGLLSSIGRHIRINDGPRKTYLAGPVTLVVKSDAQRR